MLINRVGGGGGEDVRAEVEAQTTLIEELQNLAAYSLRFEGTNVWFKYPAEGGSLVEVLVSDDENAYPNGDGGDGFEYVKATHVLGTDSEGKQFILEV